MIRSVRWISDSGIDVPRAFGPRPLAYLQWQVTFLVSALAVSATDRLLYQPGNAPLGRGGAEPAFFLSRLPVRGAHHRLEQMLQHTGRVVAQAGVNSRGLDHGAARRGQPVKALPL